MASIANHLSLVLLLTIFSSLHTHARDSQFFNKIPSNTNPNNVVPKTEQPQQEGPNFKPDNENSYGLYGHESGQLPPSATTTTTLPPSKYLPKNYNPVAYVTVPEDNANDNDDKFDNNKDNYDNYNNVAQNYDDVRQEDDQTAYRSYPNTRNNLDSNNFYDNDAGSRFSSQPFGDSKYSGGDAGFQPQGMSDTRYVENGKYFYDVGAEKYSSSHPYESLKGARSNYHAVNNGYGQFSSGNEFEGNQQTQNDFPQEENIP